MTHCCETLTTRNPLHTYSWRVNLETWETVVTLKRHSFKISDLKLFFKEMWEYIGGSKCFAMRVACSACVLTFSPDAPLVGVKGSYCAGICRNLCVTGDKLMKKKKIQLETLRWKDGQRADCTAESADNKCGDMETLGNLNENLPNLPGLRRLPEGRQYGGWKFLLIFRMTFLMISLNSKELMYLFPFLSLENK